MSQDKVGEGLYEQIKKANYTESSKFNVKLLEKFIKNVSISNSKSKKNKK